MPSIFIPISQDNYNFLQIYHPEEIRFSMKDDLGLIISTIVKVSYRKKIKRCKCKKKKIKCKCKVPERINRKLYPKDLTLAYDTFRFARNKKISNECINSVNLKLKRIIQVELDNYINVETQINPEIEIRGLVYQFLGKYGLSDNKENVARLERQNRRNRKKTINGKA